MDVVPRRGVVRALTIVFAISGFVLSLLAVILNPLFKAEANPPVLRKSPSKQRISSNKRRNEQKERTDEDSHSTTVSSSDSSLSRTSVSESPQSVTVNLPSVPRTPTAFKLQPAPPRRVKVASPVAALPPPYASTSETTMEMHDALVQSPTGITSISSHPEREPSTQIQSTEVMSTHSKRSPSSAHPHLLHHACSVIKKPTPVRSNTSPEAGLTRRSSTLMSTIKPPCPKRVLERKLRKSRSVSTGELTQTQRRRSFTAPPPVPERPKTASSALPADVPAPAGPPLRTNPYDAPYFFPHPGSPEAANYVRQAREERAMRANPSGDESFSSSGETRSPSLSPVRSQRGRRKTKQLSMTALPGVLGGSE
ncbi:hypothetical protein PLICRDRAFT_36206 [Plicaturopsis crispa FD-325 SS-3]|nr:hypothetical protein PLICRDRAFT_36206 [Plicaturopsis crispa FD-325 SS-3]